MADTDILCLLTLGKPETQTLGEGVQKFEIFPYDAYIHTKWWPFFNFFIMADTNILFLSILGKPETETLGGMVILHFPI